MHECKREGVETVMRAFLAHCEKPEGAISQLEAQPPADLSQLVSQIKREQAALAF